VRTCIVSKFPPIEGGIASRTYWRVRRLLDAGDTVAVVTNAGGVDSEYRIAGCEEHLQWLVSERGLLLRDLSCPPPWHIPTSPDYVERLLNETLHLLRTGSWDQIESDYLVPYGIVGHLASRLTGLPHVVRHGGSDIAKFLHHPSYATILADVLREASCVVTDDRHRPAVEPFAQCIECEAVPVADEMAFSFPSTPSSDGPLICAYVGKINYHWRRKGLDRIVEWFAIQDQSRISLRLVGQGVGESDFKRWMQGTLGRELPIESFVPPWEMPRLFGSLDAVFVLGLDETVQNMSLLADEARLAGLRVIESLESLTSL